MRKFILLMSLLIATALFVTGCKSKTDQRQEKEATPPATETAMKSAPEFALKNYDGTEHKLSDYKGKIVVLEWFNYECPFCLDHYEKSTAMVDLANKYMEKGVVWLAVNSTSHQQTDLNKAFAEKNNVPFPILDDRDGKVGHLYGAQRTPHIFIINKDGKIVYEGAVDNAPLGKITDGSENVNYASNALDELLAGKKISIGQTKPYGCTVKYAN